MAKTITLEYEDKEYVLEFSRDSITAMVVEINPQTQKLSLSVKEMIKKNQENEMAKYMSNSQDDSDTFSLADMLNAKKEN